MEAAQQLRRLNDDGGGSTAAARQRLNDDGRRRWGQLYAGCSGPTTVATTPLPYTHPLRDDSVGGTQHHLNDDDGVVGHQHHLQCESDWNGMGCISTRSR
jgi:hypothetical protein